MGVFQKFVEWGTDARYVPPGKKCDICSSRLGLFETGFWSINAKHLSGGVICRDCFEKLELLIKYRTRWVPGNLRKEHPFSCLGGSGREDLDGQTAGQVFSAFETLGRELLTSLGAEYTALFRIKDACFIEPTAVQVGVRRSALLKGKLVLFGLVQLGAFQKGDRVLIWDKGETRKAAILEVYEYDCGENTLEVMLKANMGKQQLSQWKTGWLVLDDTQPVDEKAVVAG